MVDPQTDALSAPSFLSFPDATAAFAPPPLPAPTSVGDTAGRDIATPPPVAILPDALFATPIPVAPFPSTPAFPPSGATPAGAPPGSQPPRTGSVPAAPTGAAPTGTGGRPVTRAAARPQSPTPRPATTPGRAAAGTAQSPATWQPTSPQPPTGAARRPARKKSKGNGGKAAGGAAAGAGLLVKLLAAGKAFGLILLHVKTVASILISVAAYAWLWGWRFAIGFVAIMFIHECGHVVVLRRQGVKATAPMFIPFFGAFVTVQGKQKSVAAEAASALAGPAAGLAASGLVLVLADAYHSPLLRAIAYTGFLMNLFNLIPMLPLDGGRVAGAVNPVLWFGGLAVAAAYLLYIRSPMGILVILIFGVPELFRRWKAHEAGTDSDYMSIPAVERWRIGGAYIAVAALCVAGMVASYSVAHLPSL